MNNNNNNTKILVVLASVLGIFFLAGIFMYFNRASTKPDQKILETTPTTEITGGPRKGELEYQEPQTKIEIGTEGVTKGTFEKVENGNIFVKEGDTLTQLPLTVDEIAVSCTTQDLSSATELDFDKVTKVNVATPANLATFIPANETVVVFSQIVDGVNRVHTVALDASKCS